MLINLDRQSTLKFCFELSFNERNSRTEIHYWLVFGILAPVFFLGFKPSCTRALKNYNSFATPKCVIRLFELARFMHLTNLTIRWTLAE